MTVNFGQQPIFHSGANDGSHSIEHSMPVGILLSVGIMFSMWDVYLPQVGLRPLDFVGFGLLCFWMLYGQVIGMRGPVFGKRSLDVIAFMLVWCLLISVVGVTVSIENAKPVVGFLLGATAFVYFNSIKLDGCAVAKALGILIFIHATYLIIQVLYYQIYGVVLNVYAGIGIEPRALSLIFRPTGLFLEPASYSVSVLMLLSIRTLIIKRLDRVAVLALGTIFLTLSTWGLIASLIFLAMHVRKSSFVWGSAVLIGFAISGTDWVNAIEESWIFERLSNLSEDTSAIDRYSGLIGISNKTFLHAQFWFGAGISNEYHEFGSNGLAFILSAGGFLGTVVFLILLLALAPSGLKVRTFIIILLLLTAAPIWTNAYWWFCLALMLRPLACEGTPLGQLPGLTANIPWRDR